MEGLFTLLIFGGIIYGIVRLIMTLAKESHAANSTGTNYNSASKKAQLKRNEQELFRMIREDHKNDK